MPSKNQKEFDPIKKEKGGQEAERVVWTTQVIMRALEAKNQGLPLKASPFLNNNTKLLKPDLVYRRTKEELEDYIHCAEDPVYFASKCYLMTPEGLKPCKLRDYQVDYLRHLQKNRFSIFLSCRQSGKSLSLLSTIKIKLKDNCQHLKKINHFHINDDIYELPIFELYNLYCEQTFIWKCKYRLYKILYKLNKEKTSQKYIYFSTNVYKLISLFDTIDFKYYHNKLLDNYKTIDDIDITDQQIEILTDTGYKPLSHLMMTKPFEQYIIKLENGYELDCADEHILFGKDFNEVYVKDLKVGDYVQTDQGLQKITSLTIDSTKISMCDTTVDDNNHRFYSNGILSHNSTTTAIYCLWVILFNIDKQGLILSKSGPAGQDLLKKIKDMYYYLPYHLKIGTHKWNQGEISFDNNSSISTESFSPTAGLGKTINFLILDEFAWCPPNDVELFYNNIIPTVTTISDSNVCIMSTQNGFNLFYKLWKAAEEHKNIYAPFKVDWWQVPQYNKTTKTWEKRTEKWKEEMVGVLGSEEAFYYQYGTQFAASDNCLVSRECLARIRGKAVLWENRIEEMSESGIPLVLRFRENMFWRPDFDFNELRTGFFIVVDDLAEGAGQDFTPFNIFQVVGKDKFKHVGRWYSNNVDLEKAALEFWLLAGQLFNTERCMWSIEWNTYGALFYNFIKNYNEPDYDNETAWRMNVCPEGIDTTNIVMYKKQSIDDQLAETSGKQKHVTKYIPGIKLTSGNKGTACSMLKMMFEKDMIDTTDLITINELENFEDKNGNGSYKASFGHDDSIMTFVQLPMIMQTAKYKNLMEEFEAAQMNGVMMSKTNNDSNTLFGDIGMGNQFTPYAEEQYNLFTF